MTPSMPRAMPAVGPAIHDGRQARRGHCPAPLTPPVLENHVYGLEPGGLARCPGDASPV